MIGERGSRSLISGSRRFFRVYNAQLAFVARDTVVREEFVRARLDRRIGLELALQSLGLFCLQLIPAAWLDGRPAQQLPSLRGVRSGFRPPEGK